MPCGGGQPLGAHDKSRIPRPVCEVVAEVPRLVGDDGDVVIEVLREGERPGGGRAVGLGASQRAEFPWLLRGDHQSELAGGALYGLGVELVPRLRADDQEEPTPALEGKELGQGIGQHGVGSARRERHWLGNRRLAADRR